MSTFNITYASLFGVQTLLLIRPFKLNYLILDKETPNKKQIASIILLFPVPLGPTIEFN